MTDVNSNTGNRRVGKVIVSEVEIDAAVRDIAADIDAYAEDLYRSESGKKILLLGILKGSVVFIADLLKRISVPIDIDYLKANNTENGLEIVLGLTQSDIAGRDIVIVEDVIDSCRTLSRLVKYLNDKGAGSVKVCTLLDKPTGRAVEFEADFVGFEIPNVYVVGYGLDHEGQFRALPYIGELI